MLETTFDKKIAQWKQETVYLIEATSFETTSLWDRHHYEYNWKEENSSLNRIIGTLDNRPINVGFTWAILHGYRICFYTIESQVGDWAAVEKYLLEEFPGVPSTNAMNFAHCLNHIDALKKKKEETALLRRFMLFTYGAAGIPYEDETVESVIKEFYK